MKAGGLNKAGGLTSGRLFAVVAGLAALVVLGLVLDLALLLGNFQAGQAALDVAAARAAAAVDEAGDLRLADTAAGPSAYAVAEQALAQSGARVTLTELVSDGQRVIARGLVRAPTVMARWFGLAEVTLAVTAAAELPALDTP